MLSGVEDGQTYRFPVGKREVFITFRVIQWKKKFSLMLKLFICFYLFIRSLKVTNSAEKVPMFTVMCR